MGLSHTDIATVIGRVMRERLQELETKLGDRIAALEENTLQFKGPFSRAEPYRRGAIVNSKGYLWVAANDIAPGGDPPPGGAWTLMFRPHRIVKEREFRNASQKAESDDD